VARAVIATHGTERHGLALAMAEALERGTVPTADGIREEREAVVRQLRDGTEGMKPYGERMFLRRVYMNFTGAEIRRISEGSGPLLERLPDDAARICVQETLVRLHRGTSYPEPSPWRARHDDVARATAGWDWARGSKCEREHVSKDQVDKLA